MPELEEYKGIKIGTASDTVLEILGVPSLITGKFNPSTDEDLIGYVVEYTYPDVKFTIARGVVEDPFYGKLNRYAVQKIEAI